MKMAHASKYDALLVSCPLDTKCVI
jgi:hypothetical protein